MSSKPMGMVAVGWFEGDTDGKGDGGAEETADGDRVGTDV